RYLNNGCFTEEILWVKESPKEGEEHLTQIDSGGSGFGLTLGLEPLWNTI
ncbi:5008_t:CDS:2, partial [Funneliformis caledonium]